MDSAKPIEPGCLCLAYTREGAYTVTALSILGNTPEAAHDYPKFHPYAGDKDTFWSIDRPIPQFYTILGRIVRISASKERLMVRIDGYDDESETDKEVISIMSGPFIKAPPIVKV